MQCTANTLWPRSGKLEIDERFHLPRKTLPVGIPPNFLHSRHAIYVHILAPHHFFQSEAAVGAPNAAALHSPVRRFADAETRNHVVHHYCASLDAAGKGGTASVIACPEAGCQPEL